MKKLKFLFYTLSLSFISLSCEDEIDIKQDGIAEESVILQNESDMQSYLNVIYANVNNDSQVAFTAMFTDETGIGVGTGGQNFDTHRFQINQANPFAQTIWYSNYFVINRVNRLIERSANITPADQVLYNSIIAQAKVLRANAYCELLYYFSPDMSNDNELGVMLVNGIPGATSQLPRSTVGQVAAQIESDLNSAYNDLPTSLTYLFARRAAVDAIRARFYLFRENYALAEQYATAASAGLVYSNASSTPTGLVDADLGIPQIDPMNVITTVNPRHNSYSSSANPYRRMFRDEVQGEMIFALDRPSAGAWSNIYGNFAFNASNATGGLMFEVGRVLANDLISLSDDVRKFNALDPTSRLDAQYNVSDLNTLRQRDVLVIDKYPGKPSAVLRNNSKLYRLSEMQLIIAECRARANDLAGATNIIENIRSARKYTAGAFTRPDFANLNEALTEILFERKVELCFEGHRFIDLKRLGSELSLSIVRNRVDDILEGLPTTLPAGDYRYTLPVPQAEVNANPTIKQNPGY